MTLKGSIGIFYDICTCRAKYILNGLRYYTSIFWGLFEIIKIIVCSWSIFDLVHILFICYHKMVFLNVCYIIGSFETFENIETGT